MVDGGLVTYTTRIIINCPHNKCQVRSRNLHAGKKFACMETSAMVNRVSESLRIGKISRISSLLPGNCFSGKRLLKSV